MKTIYHPIRHGKTNIKNWRRKMRDPIKTSDAKSFVKGYLPLLTAEEERNLFESWWATNPKGFSDFMDSENTEVRKFIGGDDNLYLTRILMAYSPAIRRSMKELANHRIEDEELLSEGLIALAEAARRFAPSEHGDVRFAAYAKVCVKGMMQGYVMRNFFVVQFCTNHNKKRLFYSMRKLIAIELQSKGTFQMTDAVIHDLAEDHSLDDTDVRMMFQMFQKPYESMDSIVGFNGTSSHGGDSTSDCATLGDTLKDNGPGTEETVLVDSEVQFHKSLVSEAMRILTHREKIVFVAQILMDKDNQRTLDDLGVEFSVSKERIRQVRIEAMNKMDSELHRLAAAKGIIVADLFHD
jgi:RNA polymerase sigma-32 factor